MDPTNMPPSAQEALRNEQEGVATLPSPTGTPKLPVQYVPWLLRGMAALNAGVGAYLIYGKNEEVKLVCLLLSSALGNFLGIKSAGDRAKDGAQ